MTGWDHVTDFLVVGSGAGVVGAVRARALGKDVLVVEKTDRFGGSTCMSGGVMWLPHNPLMRREGVSDSFDEALRYFETVVGDAGPASSDARRRAYLRAGVEMVDFLESEGVEFRRCEGYSDYYSGVRGCEGGSARGRSIEAKAFDKNRLGPWGDRIRLGFSGGLTVYTGEAGPMMLMRTRIGLAVLARVGMRTALGRIRRRRLVTNGAALTARLLQVLLRQGADVWLESALADLVVEDGRVVGAALRQNGREVRVRTRDGVLLAAGGFARNAEMREEYGGGRPTSATWTSANPGDTGEVIRIAMARGAATDMLDEAWWMPSWMMPDGTPAMCLSERSKPGAIVVDAQGRRYFNEAVAYQEAGQQMYAHELESGGAVPSWLVVDSRHRGHYPFGMSPPGRTPTEWITSGAMKRADTLEELARRCGIDAGGLLKTVERFNRFAETGVDEDFHRGEGDHEKYYGDVTHSPNPCLGLVSKSPYYAVALYPGDIGTSGGILCDEFARVLDTEGAPIAGLYATGNCTASVMGRKYLGAGASIAASAVFGYIAADHATSLTRP
ncbi:FAD-binding protein [Streptomyces cylindrosporus]|uniref:FAD-dependent oxidoreductase n=1 Tax=Streptomyces cylindrosporus TaxID=2927583 RepID=A0ABS9Y8V5_9ACTN|nr:FAD-binding protein [Streptomyces cylindrosporus]MCI3273652.1 FAD-dependent oxidoreductase [Streptomyces cylindrosporus]